MVRLEKIMRTLFPPFSKEEYHIENTNYIFKKRKKSNNKYEKKTKYYTKSKELNFRTKERNKHYALQSLYGITLKQYNEMFEVQNGCCAICGKHQNEFKKALYVDHNHKTGMIRGLLCGKCNTTLGYIEKDIDLIQKIKNYLFS